LEKERKMKGQASQRSEERIGIPVAGVARCWCRSPSSTLTWPAVSEAEASIRRIEGPTTWASEKKAGGISHISARQNSLGIKRKEE